MKLLIIGAGGHGKVVKEIAESLGIYEEIEFVDDNDEVAIAQIAELGSLREAYADAIVAIGDNDIRKRVQEELVRLDFNIPVLIHGTAYVSPSATLGRGTVVEPKAVVNTGVVIGEGTIVTMGALVDHDASVGDFCHLNTGAIVKSCACVDSLTKVDSGEVIKA